MTAPAGAQRPPPSSSGRPFVRPSRPEDPFEFNARVVCSHLFSPGRTTPRSSGTCPSPCRPDAPAWSHPTAPARAPLLRLIAGELAPTGGTVTVDGVPGYLPQTLPLASELTVAEVLGVDAVLRALRALRAIEAGDAAEEHFAVVGEDWDVEERSRHELDRLGLTDVALDRPLHTLSGGQVVSLGLAAQLLRRPDVLLLDEPINNLDLDARHLLCAQPAPHLLLLDEPTNNLDLGSVGQLENALDAYRGAFVVVSHDERFPAAIGVNRWPRLAAGRLQETGAPDGD